MQFVNSWTVGYDTDITVTHRFGDSNGLMLVYTGVISQCYITTIDCLYHNLGLEWSDYQQGVGTSSC